MKHYQLIAIFCIALFVRILYSYAVPTVFYNVDSQGYMNLGRAMIASPSVHTIITPYRTPLYPLFIAGVMHAVGAGAAVEGSPDFLRGLQTIRIIQLVIGAAAIAIFYYTAARSVTAGAQWIFGIILLGDVYIIGWETTILTEGLAISAVLLATALIFHILVSPTIKRFIGLFLLFIAVFLLRPALVVVPIVTLPLIAWYFRKKQSVVVITITTLICFLAIVIGYARLNALQYGYSGIQFVGDIDLLGRILETRVPVTSAKHYEYFYQTVTQYEDANGNPHPFRFLETYDPAIYDKPYRFDELARFNRTVIAATWPNFFLLGLSNIPEVLREVCDFTLVSPTGGNVLTRIVWLLQRTYGYAQYLTYAIPFLWIVSLVLFFRKPTRARTVSALIGTIAASQIFLTALVVYRDVGAQYGRVLSVVRPHMMLFLLLWIQAFFGRQHK